MEREEGERFGDFVIRVGMIKETTEGKTFHDDVSFSFSMGGVEIDDDNADGGLGR